MFDESSYIIGYGVGKDKGFAEGLEDGKKQVIIESGVVCTDTGSGNIVITEVGNNG